MKHFYPFGAFILLTATILLLFACAGTKLVERSADMQPPWINGIEKGYLSSEGTGATYDEAKTHALQTLKEKIIAAVSQSISVEQGVKVNEVRYRSAFRYLEEYSAKITSRTGHVSYLQGVSLSKVTDFYYEKYRHRRTDQIHYFIKYPFTDADIDKLIAEWKEYEKILTERLDTLRLNRKEYNSVESIVEEIGELQFLSDFFVDQRKALAELSQRSLRGMLSSIHIEPILDTLGTYSYRLDLGEREISTQQLPEITSNCAHVRKVAKNGGVVTILYGIDKCTLEEDNYLELAYNMGDWNLSQKVPFDVSPRKILLEHDGKLSFISVQAPLIFGPHLVKCHFTVISKSALPFRINRIEVTPTLCRKNCRKPSDYTQFPSVVFENLRLVYQGKGVHSFEAYAEVPRKFTRKWASRNGMSAIASGRIHYSSDVTGEQKVCEISQVSYTTDW